MKYTINQLAKLSGVSSRTLRYYDAIGLLKPAFYGDNQYRYYQEDELLLLQQILFFRELDFPLHDIKRILGSNDFDKIESLQRHKVQLQSHLERAKLLIKTIDKTISHLRGNITMRDTELFEGFDPIKQKEHEAYLIEKGILTQQQVEESWLKASHWKKVDWEQFKQSGEAVNQALLHALKQGLKTDSSEVQALIQNHFDWVCQFWTPNQETYLGLAALYLEHPDFRAFYAKYHPDLVEYLASAMTTYAKHHLL